MSTLDRNKPTRKDRLRLLASGVHTHYPNQSLILAGQTVQSSALEAMIQQDIAATDATVKARAAWRSLVEAERLSHQKLAPVLRALKSQVLAQFGDTQDSSNVLADFGLTPRKVPEMTTATRADALQKARATRAARHTMGAVQKKGVKGVATGPVAPPVTPAPKTETPAATPAAAGTSPQAAPTTAQR